MTSFVYESVVLEPILRNLYWILTIINTTMLDCLPAKESFADENIAVSLNKLWPWCMMTEQLREALVKLLLTFTNECPKADILELLCGSLLTGETGEVVCAARAVWALAANNHRVRVQINWELPPF
ncbi:unnamed protein product [Leptidea sinapis]|uniref:Uncharacterized protein n=1 Tax=Leptidea sinapis TaxID=189913 RepID=A0A5E4QPQ6_9NEOP|nr:unnamed protein product [Leptidea sinapis]